MGTPVPLDDIPQHLQPVPLDDIPVNLRPPAGGISQPPQRNSGSERPVEERYKDADLPLTSTQLAAAREAEKKANKALPGSSLEPKQPGLAHLVWNLGFGLPRFFAEEGQRVTGERPLPTPQEQAGEALGLAGLGGSALLKAPGAAKALAPAAVEKFEKFAEPTPPERILLTKTRKAAELIEKRAEQDIKSGSVTAQGVIDELARARAAGKPMTLPDVMGKNVLGEAGRLSRQPGPGAEAIEHFYDERNLGAVPRLTKDINEALGETTAFDARKTLMERRAEAASPLYDRAFNRTQVPPAVADRLNWWLQDPQGIGQAALKRGIDIIALEKHARRDVFNPEEYGLRREANGDVVMIGPRQNLRLFDAVKRGYDAIIEDYRDKITGKVTLDEYGRQVEAIRRAYNRELREDFPLYGKALDAWGGPSRSLDALEYGKNALRFGEQEIEHHLGQLGENDIEFARLGLRQRLLDVANEKTTGPLSQEFQLIRGGKYGQTGLRDKIRHFFNTDEELNAFVQSVSDEVQMARTSNEMLRGSHTAKRFAEDQPAIEPADVAHMSIAAALGHPFQALHRGVTAAGRYLSRPDAEVNEIASRLMSDPNVRVTVNPKGKFRVDPLGQAIPNPRQTPPPVPPP